MPPPEAFPVMGNSISRERDPLWTAEMARLAALQVLIAWARGASPCVECGRTVENGAMGRPCPATRSGTHFLDDEEARR